MPSKTRNFVYIHHFDTDGVQIDELLKVFYNEITSVSFATRYVDTFSKYLDEIPQAKEAERRLFDD